MTTFTTRKATNTQYMMASQRLTFSRRLRLVKPACKKKRITNPIIENTMPIVRFRRQEKKGLVGGLTDALTAVWVRVLISIRLPLLVIPKLLLRAIPFLWTNESLHISPEPHLGQAYNSLIIVTPRYLVCYDIANLTLYSYYDKHYSTTFDL